MSCKLQHREVSGHFIATATGTCPVHRHEPALIQITAAVDVVHEETTLEGGVAFDPEVDY